MSCDFGPVPMPTSYLETYWEEHYSRSSTANQSRSAPVTKPEKDNIAPQLMKALERLAEEQQQNEEGDKVEAEHVPRRSSRQVPAAHRRAPSFGQRLWSAIAGEPSMAQKVRVPLSRAASDGIQAKFQADEAVMSLKSVLPGCHPARGDVPTESNAAFLPRLIV